MSNKPPIIYTPKETHDALWATMTARQEMKSRHTIERSAIAGENLSKKLEMQARHKSELLPLELAIDALSEKGGKPWKSPQQTHSTCLAATL